MRIELRRSLSIVHATYPYRENRDFRLKMALGNANAGTARVAKPSRSRELLPGEDRAGVARLTARLIRVILG